MLGYVNSCAAVFPTEGQPLQHTNQYQDDGREPTCCTVCGHETNHKRGSTHDGKRHEEGILAADKVPYPSKKECAKGTHQETNGECGEIGDVGKGVISGRIEFHREDGGKAAENIKVIPLDHGADRGGKNYSPNTVLGRATYGHCICSAGHVSSS